MHFDGLHLGHQTAGIVLQTVVADVQLAGSISRDAVSGRENPGGRDD